MSWEELLALFNSNANLTKKYGVKANAEEIRNFLLDPDVLKAVRKEQPAFAKQMDTQRDIKLFTQCFDEFEKFSPMFRDCPSRLTKEQAITTFKDPEFLNLKELGNKYARRREKTKKICADTGKYGTSKLSRFVEYYYSHEDTPEAKEENLQLKERLFTPEGFQILHDQVINRVLGADLSISYPKDHREAMELNLQSNQLAEQMHTVDALISTDSALLKLNPLISEYYKYNKGQLENGGNTLASCGFFGSALSSCISSGYNAEDVVALQTANSKNGLSHEQQEVLTSIGFELPMYFGDETMLKACRELRQKNILGPNSKYIKAFEGKTRIPLNKAVEKYAQGQDIKFEEMSEKEKKDLDDAFAHPSVIKQHSKPGALTGKDFVKEAGELYRLLDSKDSMLTYSSKEFAGLKKGFKQMGAAGKFPGRDETRKFMREMLTLADKYLDDKQKLYNEKTKNGANFDHSDFTKGRIDAVTEIRDKLRLKLGSLAMEDYRVKNAARSIHTENQKSMSASLDKDNLAAFNRLKNSAAAAFKSISESSEALKADTDPAFTQLTEKVKAFNQKLPGLENHGAVRDAAKEVLTEAEKYYRDNIGKSFDKASFDRFIVAKNIILSAKTAVNGKLPVEARLGNAALKSDLAMRMAKAQLELMTQSTDKKTLAEANRILGMENGTEKLAEKILNTNAFIAAFSQLETDELMDKLAEDPQNLLSEYAEMSKNPLVDIKACKALTQTQINNSMFADTNTFNKFKSVPNPLGLAVGRHTMSSVAICAMLNDGYSVDDIADPGKFAEEKLRYGQKSMKLINEAKGFDIMRSMYSAMPKLVQYMNEKLTKLPSLMPPATLSPEYRNLHFIAVIGKDISQESKKLDPKKYLTPEELTKFDKLTLVNDMINKPIQTIGNVLSKTADIAEYKPGGSNPLDNFTIYFASGIGSSKLFAAMKKDPEFAGLDYVQCMEKCQQPDVKTNYAHKLGMALMDIPELVTRETEDNASYYLQDAKQRESFAESIISGKADKLVNLSLDKNGNYNKEKFNDSLQNFMEKCLPEHVAEKNTEIQMQK